MSPVKPGRALKKARDWRGVWSLFELFQVFAEKYIELGKTIEGWITEGPGDEVRRLTLRDHRAFCMCLEDIQTEAKETGLQVLQSLAATCLADASRRMTYHDASTRMAELSRCLHAELKSKVFFYVPSHRAEYIALRNEDNTYDMGAELKRFAPVLEKFPSITHDLTEAGNCFAFELFTACVYHLMRVCECGLVSVAKSLGVEPESASWDSILRKIQRTLQVNSSTKPQGWKAQEQFYSEAANHMTTVKNSWRNAVAHIPRVYDEPSARRIFNSVEALMMHLATRLSEAPLSVKTALDDPEAAAGETSAAGALSLVKDNAT